MKNKIKDVTCMGGKTTVQELSPVEPEAVEDKIEPKRLAACLRLLLLGMFIIGFGFTLMFSLGAYGPMQRSIYQLMFLVVGVIVVGVGTASYVLYKYLLQFLGKEKEESTDAGPTKHPSDLADHLTYERHRKGGKDVIG